jgi:hypothetical protein
MGEDICTKCAYSEEGICEPHRVEAENWRLQEQRDEVTVERDRYKAALEFYAEHPDMPLANDNGETARKALGRE